MAVVRESVGKKNKSAGLKKAVESENSSAALVQDADTLDTLLFQLSWVSHRRFEQELDAFHLTAPQFIALSCIQERGKGCSMSELAQSSHQVSATMTGIIDRLLDHGLVARERDPNDRRTLRVELTPAGKDLLEKAQARKRSWLLQFLSTLTEEERTSMIELAARYLDFIQNSFHPA